MSTERDDWVEWLAWPTADSQPSAAAGRAAGRSTFFRTFPASCWTVTRMEEVLPTLPLTDLSQPQFPHLRDKASPARLTPPTRLGNREGRRHLVSETAFTAFTRRSGKAWNRAPPLLRDPEVSHDLGNHSLLFFQWQQGTPGSRGFGHKYCAPEYPYCAPEYPCPILSFPSTSSPS